MAPLNDPDAETRQPTPEEEIAYSLASADNPRSRQHREERSDGYSIWGCVPIKDVADMRNQLLQRIDVLASALVAERAKTADVLGARDVLRDWLDGHDNGYPVGPDDQWEGDIAERARTLLEPKP